MPTIDEFLEELAKTRDSMFPRGKEVEAKLGNLASSFRDYAVDDYRKTMAGLSDDSLAKTRDAMFPRGPEVESKIGSFLGSAFDTYKDLTDKADAKIASWYTTPTNAPGSDEEAGGLPTPQAPPYIATADLPGGGKARRGMLGIGHQPDMEAFAAAQSANPKDIAAYTVPEEAPPSPSLNRLTDQSLQRGRGFGTNYPNVGVSPVPKVDTSKDVFYDPRNLQPTLDIPYNPSVSPVPSALLNPEDAPTDVSKLTNIQGVGQPEAPTETKKVYDPNAILLEQYRKPIMELAMEARKRDLARMDNPVAASQAHHLLAQGIMTGDSALQTAGASLLRESQFAPLYQPSLKAAGESAQQAGAGQLVSDKLDPSSQVSKAAVMAFHTSDDFNNTAKRMADSSGGSLSEVDARIKLYNETRGLSAVGVAAYNEAAKASTDMSETRAKTVREYSIAKENEARTRQLAIETNNAQSLYEAWNNPNSAVSQVSREQLRTLLPHGVAESTKDYDRLTAHELSVKFPDQFRTSAELLRWLQEYNTHLSGQTQVDKEWRVRTETVPGPNPGMPGRQVANQIGVENKANFMNQNTQARIAIEAADKLFAMVSGPEDTLTVAAQGNDGQEIIRTLNTFARAAASLSPTGKQLFDELVNNEPKGTFIPSQFIFGAKGKKNNVRAALMEMVANHETASKPFVNEQVQILGKPPAYPPTYMPMEIVPDKDTKTGKTVQTYVFNILGHKWRYYRNKAGQWVAPEEVK